MAFVTVTKPQLRKLAKTASSPATRILSLRENPERTLSIIQIGITLVGMISAAVGGAGAEESFAPIFEQRFGMSERASEGLAIVLVVIPLTIFSVVLGELVPKTIALRSPLKISLLGARWILLADRLLSPLVTFLETMTKFVLKLLPKRASEMPSAGSQIELEHLSAPTQQYIANIVETETRKVREVMVPWSAVSTISVTADRSSVASAAITSGHTRIPVVEWHGIIRPVLYLKESEYALAALRLMQSKRTNMCIIVDQNSRPIGIVTLEDIIEEVVGDLFDEDDDGRVRKILSSHARRRLR